jgi:hypothetical protein
MHPLIAQRGVEYRIQWSDKSLTDDWISESAVLEDYPEAVQSWQKEIISGTTRRGSIALGPRDSNRKVSYITSVHLPFSRRSSPAALVRLR